MFKTNFTKNGKKRKKIHYIIFKIKKQIYLCTGIKLKKQRRVFFNLYKNYLPTAICKKLIYC